MPNRRRSGAYSDLQGEARQLELGRQIESLKADGFETDKISALMGLQIPTIWRYSYLYRAHLRANQQPTPTRGTAGLKD